MEVEPRERTSGHAVGAQNSGDATLSRRQVEGDAMGVAVAGHHGETEAAALKDVEIPRVVANQLDHAQRLEKLVPPMQQACDPKDAPNRCVLTKAPYQD